MSAGKGGKRISVFDRLGPGTDEVRTVMSEKCVTNAWGNFSQPNATTDILRYADGNPVSCTPGQYLDAVAVRTCLSDRPLTSLTVAITLKRSKVFPTLQLTSHLSCIIIILIIVAMVLGH